RSSSTRPISVESLASSPSARFLRAVTSWWSPSTWRRNPVTPSWIGVHTYPAIGTSVARLTPAAPALVLISRHVADRRARIDRGLPGATSSSPGTGSRSGSGALRRGAFFRFPFRLPAIGFPLRAELLRPVVPAPRPLHLVGVGLDDRIVERLAPADDR